MGRMGAGRRQPACGAATGDVEVHAAAGADAAGGVDADAGVAAPLARGVSSRLDAAAAGASAAAGFARPAGPPAASGVFSLSLSNGLALLAAVAAAALYARWLSPPQFAQWALALTVARAGLLLLDGGLKTALVRRAVLPSAVTLHGLGRLSAALAALLTAGLAGLALGLWWHGRLDAGEALLLAAYPMAYLLPYPAMFAALARLERARCFGPVGRAEAASVALEFALPAVLIAAGLPYWAAFIAAAVAARGLRSAWIVRAALALSPEGALPLSARGSARWLAQGRGRPIGAAAAGAGAGAAGVAVAAAPAAADGPAPRPADLLKEGAGVQAVAALSMLRDQLHLWLLAPWWGLAWAGAYTLAYTACAIVCQVGVQTAMRVALPALRAAPPAERWPQVLARVRVLAMVTLPPLALLPAWLAHADAQWWGGRWHDAVAIAPWVAARMVPGVATTVLGAWLMVACKPWRSARVHAAWAGAEVVLTGLALALLGPLGLAVAGAVTPWAAIALFLAAATADDGCPPPWPVRARALARALCARPSAWAALALAAWVTLDATALPWATLALPLCWWAEADVRRWARPRRHGDRDGVPPGAPLARRP